MKYREAIEVCNSLDRKAIMEDAVSDDTVLDAVSVILDMETINAVPKQALLNVLRWFWEKTVDVDEPLTVVEHDYVTPREE